MIAFNRSKKISKKFDSLVKFKYCIKTIKTSLIKRKFDRIKFKKDLTKLNEKKRKRQN